MIVQEKVEAPAAIPALSLKKNIIAETLREMIMIRPVSILHQGSCLHFRALLKVRRV
jgi:hypothetical protein